MKKIITIASIISIIFVMIFIIVYINVRKNFEVQVPVIMYHYIANYGTDVSKLEDKTIISADAFEEQMNWLYENGYKSLTMKEFLCWKNGQCELDNKRFLVTFDDGFTSTSIYEYVEKYGDEINFFIVINASIYISNCGLIESMYSILSSVSLFL